jgi:rhomboid family protein
MRSVRLVPIIIILNILVFLLWSTGDEARLLFMDNNFTVSWEALQQGRWWVLLTSVFSHQLFLHLLLNMYVLKGFGDAIESILGSGRFLAFYLIAGILSSFSHAAVTAFLLGKPDLPAVGASGAIAAILILFCLLYPKEKLLLFGFIPLPAMWGALTFVGLDIWGLISQAEGGGLPIGHGAHLGGALCGLLAYFFLQPRLVNERRS